MKALRLTYVFFALSLVVLPLAGQDTVAQIRESAFRKYADGEFADALPYFEQLIEIQGASKVSQVAAGLERVYYSAAMCQFVTGNFAGAEQAFVR